ncbi:MAG: hypothetical protein LBI80_01150 [Endomicrobium sp.]|nr:hypothetical protein [Endomicrobium sp.]
MGNLNLISWPDVYTLPSINISTYNTVNISNDVNNFWGIYGALANPIVDNDSSTLKSTIEASYNIVNISSNCICDNLIGASVLGATQNDSSMLLLSSNIDNSTSTVNLFNNIVNVNANVDTPNLFAAHVYLDAPNRATLGTTWNVNLNNNLLSFNSPSLVVANSIIAVADLTITGDSYEFYPFISLSNNTLELNSNFTNTNYLHLTNISLYNSDTVHIDSITVTGNKLLVKAPVNVSDCQIYAYEISQNAKDKASYLNISNNVVIIDNVKAVTLGGIYNFDTFAFSLPNNITNNDNVLNLANQATDIEIDYNKLTMANFNTHTSTLFVNLVHLAGDAKLSMINNPSYLENTQTSFELGLNNKSLIFTFDPFIVHTSDDKPDVNNPIPVPTPDPDSPTLLQPLNLYSETVVIPQAGAANVSFIIQGLDLIMDEGLFSARNQAKASSHNNEPFFSSKGLSPFAAFSTSKNKFFTSNTNDIDVNAFSIIAGLAKDSSIFNHNLTLGLFFEHGQGKYETSTFFQDSQDDWTVLGNGNAYYNGGGILARLDLVNNIYFDASARLGNVSSDYFTSDLSKISSFGFDYSTTYYGAHGGLGYLLNLNDNLGLDFSGKYFFTNLAGKNNVELPGTYHANFKTESIQKVKLGVKIQHFISDKHNSQSIYFGGSFEYEPANKIKVDATKTGFLDTPIDTPELGGGRGLVEAGFNTSYKNIGVDLSAKYSDGKAGNSMAGMLKFSYKI